MTNSVHLCFSPSSCHATSEWEGYQAAHTVQVYCTSKEIILSYISLCSTHLPLHSDVSLHSGNFSVSLLRRLTPLWRLWRLTPLRQLRRLTPLQRLIPLRCLTQLWCRTPLRRLRSGVSLHSCTPIPRRLTPLLYPYTPTSHSTLAPHSNGGSRNLARGFHSSTIRIACVSVQRKILWPRPLLQPTHC